MSLKEYHRKRNFSVTPEPRGEEAPGDGRSFVIQKHAASRLHYDFRLELEGVLKSWSVPKGPSYDPTVKRLAMATEDHPVDYGGFEGIIPRGEYGGGTVLLWDQGTWEPVGDPHQEYRSGNLKFELRGQKLRGRWALVRIRSKDQRDADRTWLLIKERDAQARPESELDITAERPESVTTGRSLEEIAAASDRVWHSNRPPSESPARWKPVRAQPRAPLPALTGARAGELPAHLPPQRGKVARKPPAGDDWLHELAIDGPRLLGRIEAGKAQLLDGGGQDWTTRLPALARAAAALPVSEALLDGAATVLMPDGTTSRSALEQHLAGRESGPVAYFLFDLLFLDGQDLRKVPLETRKQALAALVGAARGPLRYTDHIVGGGPALFEQACARGVGGVVSKRRGALHRAGEGKDWVVAVCASVRREGDPSPRRSGEREKKEKGMAKVTKEKRGKGKVVVAGIELSHPERVLYPDAGITKLALAQYYEAVEERVLPQVVSRPLALVRCPDGLAGQCFYMKHAMPSVATALRRVKIREQTKTGEYLHAESLAGIVALVQMSVLEIHTWNSTAERLEEPDRAVFDLDPGPEVPWPEVARAARTVRERVEGLGLRSFVKTTGGKGLHVVVPLMPLDWDACFTFSQLVAEAIAAEDPGRYTTAMPKAGREKKILLDYFRNRRGSTSVAAYSSRARPGAPVSTPIDWDEIDDCSPAHAFTVLTLPGRLAALRRDPWADYEKSRRPLAEVLDAMGGGGAKTRRRSRRS